MKEYIKKSDRLNILVLEDMVHKVRWFYDTYSKQNIYIYDNVKDIVSVLTLKQDVVWNILYLSHDLDNQVNVDSNEYNTGYTVAKYIAEHKIFIEKIIIHSSNNIGAENIHKLLPLAEVIPFNQLVKDGRSEY
jgi:hypothetical protein